MTTITIDRAVVEQALEALEYAQQDRECPSTTRQAIAALRAALAQEQDEPTGKQPLQVESVATTQQPAGETPPSDYRRSYWDGFNIGKREGRIEAEDALAQQDEPETCTWYQDGDSDSGVYATSCRHYFNLEDGTPEDNKMQWCCYCGKKLVQELITEGDDE